MKYKKLLMGITTLSLLLGGCSIGETEKSSNNSDLDSNYKYASSIVYGGSQYESIEDLKKDIGYTYGDFKYKEDVITDKINLGVLYNDEFLAYSIVKDEFQKDIINYYNKVKSKKEPEWEILDVKSKALLENEYYMNHYTKVLSRVMDKLFPVSKEDFTKYSKGFDKSKRLVAFKLLDSKSEAEAETKFKQVISEDEKLGISKDSSNKDLEAMLKNQYILLNYTDALSYGYNAISRLSLPKMKYKTMEKITDINDESVYSNKFKEDIQKSKDNSWHLVLADDENRELYLKNKNKSQDVIGDFAYKVVSVDRLTENEFKLYIQRQKFLEHYYKNDVTTQEKYLVSLIKDLDSISKNLDVTKELYTKIENDLKVTYGSEKNENDGENKTTESYNYKDEITEKMNVTIMDLAMTSLYTPYYSEEFTQYLISKK